MANTYLSRSEGAGNRKTFTLSAWCKRSSTGSSNTIFSSGTNSDNYFFIDFANTNKFQCLDIGSGSYQIRMETNRLIRDCNGFYHIVIAVDTTQSTASNRVKMYINGVQETSFSTATYPSQNYDTNLNNSNTANIGRYVIESSRYFDGVMSYVAFVDGQQLTPSTFGSTDATTGEWKINTSPSVTYGTNGFFILKDGNSVTDQSGNSNNFTVGGGTLTKTEDCPDNVFCTLNPLIGFTSSYGEAHSNAPTYSLGNTKFTKSQATWSTQGCTLGASSGKYYWEAKMENNGGDPRLYIGIVDAEFIQGERGHVTGQTTNGVGYNSNNGKVKVSGGTDATYGNSFTSSDVVGCALDLDNRKIYFHKNGTWQNSGDPTSGSTGTGSATTLTADRTYIPSFTIHNSGCLANFGNGYFGTTAVTTNSGNGYAGADGKSIFNYQPPTGYTALSTKGLNL